MRSVIGTPISERIRTSSSSSQSTGFPPLNRSIRFLKNPKAIRGKGIGARSQELGGIFWKWYSVITDYRLLITDSPSGIRHCSERSIEIEFHAIENSIHKF